MSRIGKQPVTVPSGVQVKLAGRTVTVTGPKGTLSWTHPPATAVSVDEGGRTVTVTRADDTKPSRAIHGLTRALVNNMVKGVFEGFEKRLLIFGTGYNARLQGRTLMMNLGYSGRGHGRPAQFSVPIPDGVEVVVEREAARGEQDPAVVVVRGCDKKAVGQFAADVRALRKTEPYKGKGVRYHDEQVRRKQGKALTGGG